ncbi:hypothetical protein U1Q18_007393 [Sarracenia purpurea var. burkii]
MSDDSSTPIHPSDEAHHHQNSENNHNSESETNHTRINGGNNNIVRKERPSRACAARATARLYEAAAAEAAVATAVRKRKAGKKERVREKSPELSPPSPQCKILTELVGEPPPSQLPRWSLRSMWELASILNFFNTFRPLLNIKVEFSVEEFETALIAPNNTLGDIHIPLLKSHRSEAEALASNFTKTLCILAEAPAAVLTFLSVISTTRCHHQSVITVLRRHLVLLPPQSMLFAVVNLTQNPTPPEGRPLDLPFLVSCSN